MEDLFPEVWENLFGDHTFQMLTDIIKYKVHVSQIHEYNASNKLRPTNRRHVTLDESSGKLQSI